MSVSWSLVVTFLQGVMIFVAVISAAYTFHRKLIIPDLKKYLYSREEGTNLEKILYPRAEAIIIARDIFELKREYREDIKIIQSDIKKLLSHYGD